MALDVLTDLEQRAWHVLLTEPSAARSFYETVLDERIVVLLADRLLIQERDAALAVLCGEKWESFRLGGLSAERLSPVGFVSYGVVAAQGGAPYSARVSSVYAHRGDGWKLTFHQCARR